ncbi:hypothetical protein DH2020_004277 [Rehmannia glutinosa]|uniref:Large ribosomal subunit protein eL24-related N-terminal domain-containing protein n=1 Tax=Rehmannia glutinosa TaxID=99300 RepID=A0ABR0XNY6_REHGL
MSYHFHSSSPHDDPIIDLYVEMLDLKKTLLTGCSFPGKATTSSYMRKMKRNPRKVKWTKAYRRLHGKDMTQDATYEFERKRNRPERYDRNVTENTLKAIKKIDKVRVDRESRHHAKRMKGKKAQLHREATKELEQSIHMVKAPSVLQQEPSLTLPNTKVKVSQLQT